VIVLGDVFCTGSRLGPTVELLRPAHPVGVWGNHDFGLCFEPDPPVREKYSGPVLDFMGTLRPRLEIGGYLFSHVEPWLDPTDITQLWWFEGPPDTPERAAQSFGAWPQRLLFVGHFHRWLVVTPTGLLAWGGERPITLAPPERYLVAVAALCEGRCAVFDTETSELLPCDLGQA
jgi:hypothetical protein